MAEAAPGYLQAVGVLFSGLVQFAEDKSAQLHIGRRASGGWTVAVEWGEDGEQGLEAHGAHGVGEGIGEAFAPVAKQLELGQIPIKSTLPPDVAEAYVLGRNTGYSAAHAAAEVVMKRMAEELAKARDELEDHD